MDLSVVSEIELEIELNSFNSNQSYILLFSCVFICLLTSSDSLAQKRMYSLQIVHGEDQAARLTRKEKYRQQDIPLARSARMIRGE